jgi:hypothetical protein
MIADEIRAVLAAKGDALVRRSADDMAALLHPDFVYVNTSGRKFDKAIATMTLDDDFTVDGREVKATFKSLCVFTKKDGKWLWSAGQTMWPSP